MRGRFVCSVSHAHFLLQSLVFRTSRCPVFSLKTTRVKCQSFTSLVCISNVDYSGLCGKVENYTRMKVTALSFFLAVILLPSNAFGARKDDSAVLLRDVEVITLNAGKMTNGRRSSPVPQLKCVGGTAGCSAFRPQVVQCYNRGWDGQDVQWECKTEMDRAYQFGAISVNCEGYSYPDDPYILRGSCGLEYTIDYSKEGQSGGRPHPRPTPRGSPWTLGSIASIIIILIIMYSIYSACLRSAGTERMSQYSTTNDDQGGPGYPGRGTFGGNQFRPSAPPPAGFHPDYTTGAAGASCGAAPGVGRTSGGSGFGGFWSGLATGGMLGYLFGNRNTPNAGGYTGYGRRQYSDYTSNENWGGTSSSGFYRQRDSDSSGVTHETSGFGGTTRR